MKIGQNLFMQESGRKSMSQFMEIKSLKQKKGNFKNYVGQNGKKS